MEYDGIVGCFFHVVLRQNVDWRASVERTVEYTFKVCVSVDHSKWQTKASQQHTVPYRGQFLNYVIYLALDAHPNIIIAETYI